MARFVSLPVRFNYKKGFYEWTNEGDPDNEVLINIDRIEMIEFAKLEDSEDFYNLQIDLFSSDGIRVRGEYEVCTSIIAMLGVEKDKVCFC